MPELGNVAPKDGCADHLTIVTLERTETVFDGARGFGKPGGRLDGKFFAAQGAVVIGLPFGKRVGRPRRQEDTFTGAHGPTERAQNRPMKHGIADEQSIVGIYRPDTGIGIFNQDLEVFIVGDALFQLGQTTAQRFVFLKEFGVCH